MKFFRFNKKQNNSENSTSNENAQANESAQVNEKADKDTQKITIGTGMPIGTIYYFIATDLSQKGYEDALVNPSYQYCQQYEDILQQQLLNLMAKVELRYQMDISHLDTHIENCKAFFAISSIAQLTAQKNVYLQHLDKIEEMRQQLNNNDSRVTLMIQTYRRGFMKGLSQSMASITGQNYFMATTPSQTLNLQPQPEKQVVNE
ncbi:MAG: hypothetical protein K2G64_06765 [Muribaculaceae bacterium]|nr:hypothetical protein [Muribaculaceae bacterium]MDE5968790.1 hypothetical protein [Muribaculaceae bacterium]MDE7393711.1 hypothetical protein [Muribaculaceae bacterium]